MKNISSVIGFTCFFLLMVLSKAYSYNFKETSLQPFQLHDGDRVVFLGNSLMEDDQRYGYIEFALTTRWPDSDVTYRNLGWSGDNVFGKARSYYTPNPGPYKLMIQQLKDANPNVVFIAYGAVESYKGKKGLPHFRKGLNQLIDKIDSIGAKSVLLSPLPQMDKRTSIENLNAHNNELENYTSAISDIASQRNLRFIDLFTPIKHLNNKVGLTTDGIHLNEMGYYYLTSLISSGLDLPKRNWSIEINLSNGKVNTKGAEVSILKMDNDKTQFQVKDHYLPLPAPPLTQDLEVRLPPLGQNFNKSVPPFIEKQVGDAHRIKITGLKKGCYSLMVDGAQAASASAKEWAQGVVIHDGTSFRQAMQLRYKILEKNKQFFHQYRPLNRTYLIGFRTYEQGQNYKELKELDMFIRRLEEQIAELRVPQKNDYQVVAVK